MLDNRLTADTSMNEFTIGTKATGILMLVVNIQRLYGAARHILDMFDDDSIGTNALVEV